MTRIRPGAELADSIWYGLRLARADKVTNVATDKPDVFRQRIHGGALHAGEQQAFRDSCDRLAIAAAKAGADVSTLADRIRRVLDAARVEATKARAAQLNRLDQEGRKDYRKRAAQAGDLARWLAEELTGRQTAAAADSLGVVFNWRDPEQVGRTVATLGDLLPQRYGMTSRGDNAEALLSRALAGRDIDPAGMPELHRAAELVGSLRWLAGLLRADAERAKPAKRPPAIWKPTARAMREAFAELLGAPHLIDVATITGLAFKCEIPIAELSKG